MLTHAKGGTDEIYKPPLYRTEHYLFSSPPFSLLHYHITPLYLCILSQCAHEIYSIPVLSLFESQLSVGRRSCHAALPVGLILVH